MEIPEESDGKESGKEAGYAELIFYSGSGRDKLDTVFYEEDLLEETKYEQKDPYVNYELDK